MREAARKVPGIDTWKELRNGWKDLWKEGIEVEIMDGAWKEK